MKRMILAVFGAGALIGLALAMNRPKIAALSEAAKETEAASAPAQTERQPRSAVAPLFRTTVRTASGGGEIPAPVTTANVGFDFRQAIETLVSAQASFRDKQA